MEMPNTPIQDSKTCFNRDSVQPEIHIQEHQAMLRMVYIIFLFYF